MGMEPSGLKSDGLRLSDALLALALGKVADCVDVTVDCLRSCRCHSGLAVAVAVAVAAVVGGANAGEETMDDATEPVTLS